MNRDFSLEALDTALSAAWNMNQVILSYEEELEKIASMASTVTDLATETLSRAAKGVEGLGARAAAPKKARTLFDLRPGATQGAVYHEPSTALQGVVQYEPTMSQAATKTVKAPVQQAARTTPGTGIAQRLGGVFSQAQKIPGQLAAGIQGAGVNFRAGLSGRSAGTQRVLESAQGAVQQQRATRGALATPKGAPVSDPMTYQVPTPQNIQGPGRVRPQPLQQGQVFQQAGTPVVPNPRPEVFVPPTQGGGPAPGGYFQELGAPQIPSQAKNWWANRSAAERAALIGGAGAAGGMLVGSSLD